MTDLSCCRSSSQAIIWLATHAKAIEDQQKPIRDSVHQDNDVAEKNSLVAKAVEWRGLMPSEGRRKSLLSYQKCSLALWTLLSHNRRPSSPWIGGFGLYVVCSVHKGARERVFGGEGTLQNSGFTLLSVCFRGLERFLLHGVKALHHCGVSRTSVNIWRLQS